ncbi:amino acid ABC transporter permease [Kineococcus sp. SYSU DK005]|uniref:amino acid ABC transporter permease n=1 Tax=Kineococcus sp. SYSU DK005 TaxID=3383126 RepID=UPI003D7C3DA6
MQVLLDNLGTFGRGAWGTVVLFAWSAVGSLVVGTLLACLRVAPSAAMRAAGTAYVNVVRNTPLTLVMFFSVLALPQLQIRFGESLNTQFRVFAVLALIAYTSCFVCEAIRSGINTVPVGQAEAARAIGLPFGQVLTLVVLPQAFRAVVPPMGNIFIALVKNTSVASAFSNYELISAMRNLIEQNGNAVISILVGITAAYVLLVAVVALVFNLLERSVGVPA